MTKGTTQHEDIAIQNMYAINNRDVKCIKQKVINLKGKIEKLKLSTVLSQQLIELDRKSVTLPTNRIQLTFLEHLTQQKQNICSFQLPREHIQRYILSHKTSLKFF